MSVPSWNRSLPSKALPSRILKLLPNTNMAPTNGRCPRLSHATFTDPSRIWSVTPRVMPNLPSRLFVPSIRIPAVSMWKTTARVFLSPNGSVYSLRSHDSTTVAREALAVTVSVYPSSDAFLTGMEDKPFWDAQKWAEPNSAWSGHVNRTSIDV